MQALVNVLPASVFKAVVVLLRTANNVIGGMSFVTCARIIGSQKGAPREVVEEPVVEVKKGKSK